MTTPRPRDSVATRRAILDAARAAFVAHGYEGAGTRAIAGAAGVDPRLITRYFGSKEQLFGLVVEETYTADHVMMTPDVTDAAARVLLSDPTADLSDGLVLTLRSATNPRAAQIMRDCLAAHFQKQLTDRLDGADAEARAALLIAICAGVQFQRNVLGERVLNETDVDVLAPYLRAALDAVAVAPRRAERDASTAVG